LYLTLKRQYELAAIEERRDVPLLSVLDRAVEPAFRYSPRRKILTLFGLFLGFTTGAAVAIWRRM
jgi:tyrosine-protein kinase Etk/Wzc